MVRVLVFRNYRVYIFSEVGGKHHEPHCHVMWPDGRSSVSLVDFEILAGGALPRRVIEFLRLHQSDLMEFWRVLHEEK